MDQNPEPCETKDSEIDRQTAQFETVRCEYLEMEVFGLDVDTKALRSKYPEYPFTCLLRSTLMLIVGIGFALC